MKCYTFPPGISRARLYDDSLEPRPMNSRYVVADGSYAIVLFLSKSDGKNPGSGHSLTKKIYHEGSQ